MSDASSLSSATSVLYRQYRQLTDPKKRIPSFHIELENDNIFSWNIGVMVLNKDSIYHGGYFKAQMKFPHDYPFKPPTFRFTPPIHHPNVYKDGKLCISILHTAGDQTSQEPDAETWSPVQTVESVLISIISLLEDPNVDSPANVDAALDWRKDKKAYYAKVQAEVQRSKQDIPEDFVMPTSIQTAYSGSVPGNPDEANNETIDENFWYDSDQSFEEDSLMEDNFEEDDDDEEDGSSSEQPDAEHSVQALDGTNAAGNGENEK